jgi:hypothetical protein
MNRNISSLTHDDVSLKENDLRPEATSKDTI